MPHQLSARALNSTVTLLIHAWGKDAAGGRVITSTATIPNVACQWDPESGSTSVDDTGRWTTEQTHAFRFRTDPALLGLKEQDVIQVIDAGQIHSCVVVQSSNAMGRSVYFEVHTVERS